MNASIILLQHLVSLMPRVEEYWSAGLRHDWRSACSGLVQKLRACLVSECRGILKRNGLKWYSLERSRMNCDLQDQLKKKSCESFHTTSGSET